MAQNQATTLGVEAIERALAAAGDIEAMEQWAAFAAHAAHMEDALCACRLLADRATRERR